MRHRLRPIRFVAWLPNLFAMVIGLGSSAVAASENSTAPHLWITADQVVALPRTGESWAEVERWAARSNDIVLGDRDENGDVALLAATYKALAEDDQLQLAALRANILGVPGTELITPDDTTIGPDDEGGNGESLALARNLPSLLIAARLVDLGEADIGFRAWLADLLSRRIGTQQRSLISTHEDRANNWGTHAGAARIAAALYLNDTTQLETAAAVFRGWLGERESYTGFNFGEDRSWHANPLDPIGINPRGATLGGHPVGGVLPDDQRQAGSFTWPPIRSDRAWEAMQGAVLQAQLLADNGFSAWEWGDRALLRAAQWLLEEAGQPPTGDDLWILPLLDHAYGTRFSRNIDLSAGRPGKNIGFTALTHPKFVAVNSAVLPSSRASTLGNTVTVLAAIVTDDAATACTINPEMASKDDLTLNYQRFDAETGAVQGKVDEPMDLVGGVPRYLVMSITPKSLRDPAELDFGFRCHEGNAPTVIGLNTLLLSASDLPVPDMVALVATLNNNGIVDLPGAGAGFGYFSVATANLGAAGELTARPVAADVDLDELLICATDAATGDCLGAPTTEVTVTVAAAATPTFAVFARTAQPITFDPAVNRLRVDFIDNLQFIRGRTSVALRSIAAQ